MEKTEIKLVLPEWLNKQVVGLMEGYAQGFLRIVTDAYNEGHLTGEQYAYQNMLAMLDHQQKQKKTVDK